MTTMIILDLNKKDIDLILAALDTHEETQLPDEVKAEPEREVAFKLVESVRERLGADPPSLMVTGDELAEIRQALDSHKYWDLSDMNYRHSGYVYDPGSDDSDTAKLIVELDKLDEKLEAAEEKLEAEAAEEKA